MAPKLPKLLDKCTQSEWTNEAAIQSAASEGVGNASMMFTGRTEGVDNSEGDRMSSRDYTALMSSMEDTRPFTKEASCQSFAVPVSDLGVQTELQMTCEPKRAAR